MLTHLRRRGAAFGRPLLLLCAAGVVSLGASLTAGCDKLPLLAPSGTVITLFAGSNALASHGEMDLIATLVEQGTTTTPSTGTGGGTGTTSGTSGTAGAGTPVHNGTLVTFTTTLGRVEPSEARTHNGQVTVKLISSGQSGTAHVIAFSGGAKSAELLIKVGTAAAGRVIVSASPQTLSSSGGTSEIVARVEDEGGLLIGGVPVTFTTDAGSVSPQTATTDANGVARATLTTTRTAKVTARAGAQTADVTVSVNGKVGVNITPPAGTIAVGQPATFTVTVNAPTGTTVSDVRVDFGDGASQSISVAGGTATHTYTSTGVFRATATVTDVTGERTTAQTEVTVGSASVSLACTVSGRNATCTATPNPAGLAVDHYEWNFGDGSPVETAGPTITHRFPGVGPFTVTVTLFPVSGPSVKGQTSVILP